MCIMTLEDYLLDAKKIMISKRCGNLVNDEEAIGEVASRMMWADHTWNGKSKRSTWRYNQANYAIHKILKKRKNQKKTISLSTIVNHSENKNVYLGDIIEDKAVSNQYNDILEVINKELYGKTKDCFNMYYVNGMTLQEIGDHYGFSRERARQYVDKGKNKIKKCMLN